MYVRKFNTSKDVLLEQGKKIVTESADNKYVYRVSMVNLMLAGMPAEKLAELCGDSKRTLIGWMQKVDDYGWDSLLAKKQEGRPRRLTSQQEEEIREALKKDPQDFDYNVWDGPSLSDFIMKKYNVTLGVRSCQKLMHRLGFSLVRSQTYPSLENPDNERREEFKKKSG